MRLNAYLARAGVSSRRGADELIKSGRVYVNGQVGKLNTSVSDDDEVKLDDKIVRSQLLRYILLYKPSGYITSLKDERHRPQVTDLLSISERVVPVGRLDFNTTGALLLTNDGELAHRLMHPSFEIDKVYEATVEGNITPEILKKLNTGMELEDGKTAPAQAKRLAENRVELIIHEGRKHQVKRMLSVVGLRVKKLHRPRYGKLDLSGLKPGEWRELTKAEITQLKLL